MTMLGGTYSGSYDAETVASFMLRGQSNNHRVGQGIARAGDRNGDGLEDFWVGSYGFNSYAGAILLFEGRELTSFVVWSASPAQPAQASSHRLAAGPVEQE